ncbi:MAG TPA: helix-turn-helix domain-containing protein [Gaiellaceae bacterium]|jgi:AcrR family transcriptional regulator
MVATTPTRTRLTPADWVAAALDAIAEGGLSSVAVEALAPKVGASKGSFYWHFADRAALLEAAFDLWEQTRTEAIIEELRPLADPKDRLRRLFAIAIANPRAGRIEAALASEPPHRRAAAVLRRASRRRLAFVRETLMELGFDEEAADHRALIIYTAFLGFFSLQQAAGAVLPSGRKLDDYLDSLLDTVTRR